MGFKGVKAQTSPKPEQRARAGVGTSRILQVDGEKHLGVDKQNEPAAQGLEACTIYKYLLHNL